MKKLAYIFVGLLVVLWAGCKKDSTRPEPTATVYVINAAVGTGAIKIDAGADEGFAWAGTTAVAYGTIASSGSFTGNRNIRVVTSPDTTKTLLSGSFTLSAITTIYLSGQAPNVDTLFRAETSFPYNPGVNYSSDNSFYLRIVNLSPNSNPLNISIRNATVTEAIGLAYKGITAFKKYDAQATTPNYVFDIRDATTNALLGSFTLSTSTSRFKTISLVIKGLTGTTSGPDAFGVFQANYN